MPFYDNYFTRGESISPLGRLIISREVRNRIHLAQTLTKKNSLKTLELGPGKGHFAHAALDLGWEYLGVDGSPAVLKKLSEENIQVINSFVPPLPGEVGEGYDLVLMEHFMEHMESPLSARVLASSVHGALVKNGLIFIVSPDYLAHRSNFWDCDYTHAFVTTNQRLSQLLQDCDFEICYTGYETLGLKHSFVTWLISEITQVLYMFYFPQLLSLLVKGSIAPSNKWRNVLLRSCVVVGRKK